MTADNPRLPDTKGREMRRTPIYGDADFPPGRKIVCDVLITLAVIIFLMIGVITFLGALNGR